MDEFKVVDIERRLSSLVGKAITAMYKDGDGDLCIEFIGGEDAEYLTIMCFFRFILDGEIILSSNDLYEIEGFEEPEKTIVKEAKVGYFGDVTLLFDNGARLEITCDTSYDKEMWQLTEMDEQATSHFVVTPYNCGRIRGKASISKEV